MAITITTADDAAAVLQRIASGDDSELQDRLVFDGWPKFELRIQGEDFSGGIPTRVMPSLIELQNAINKEYAIVLGRESGRLTEDQKRDVELIVFVGDGSTKFIADLAEALNKLTSVAEKMNSNTAAAIIALGFAYASYSGWVATLKDRADERKVELEIIQTEAELERMRILRDAATTVPRIREQALEASEFHANTLRRLEPSDALLVDDKPLVSGETGGRLAKKLPDEPVEARLDGQYVILSVDSGGVKDGYRLKVKPSSGGDDLRVSVPKGTLNSEQIDVLKSGEWDKKPVRMQMNIKKRRDKIVSAILIEAGLSK